MDCVIYKQRQSENDVRKHSKRIMLSDWKDSLAMFSRNQIVSAWRELPDKERLLVLLVDLRHLGVESVAEIMNKPIATVIRDTRQARALVRKKILSDLQRD